MSELIRVIAGSLMGHILITCLKLASLTLNTINFCELEPESQLLTTGDKDMVPL